MERHRTTIADAVQLMISATSQADWDAKAEQVKTWHSGRVPEWWQAMIFDSGIAADTWGKWEYKSPPLDQLAPSPAWSKQWNDGRAYIEANLETATVGDKDRFNVWDRLDVVWETVKRSLSGEWSWCRNTACKYIDIRIDMRDGNCIIKDNTGKRIGPAELRRQFGEELKETT